MPNRLVVLSEGFTGRSHELKADRTTIGRVDDNAFCIPEASVSSHHCEILLKGNDVVVKDLDSTNGTYINDERVTEAVLRPGQILRLGQLEIRLETGASSPASRKAVDQTMIVPQGVKFGESGTGGSSPAMGGKDTPTALFRKRSENSSKIFWWIVGIVIVVVAGTIAIALLKLGK